MMSGLTAARLAAAAAALCASALWSGGARAATSPACDDYREKILTMERSGPRPSGWLSFDAFLRKDYTARCVNYAPRVPRPQTYWYDVDGNKVSGPPDVDKRAAFSSTEERVAQCRETGKAVSTCVLMLDADAAEERRDNVEAFDVSPALPDLTVELDGTPYAMSTACVSRLVSAVEGAGADVGDEYELFDDQCRDFGRALLKRIGGDPGAFANDAKALSRALAKAYEELGGFSAGYNPVQPVNVNTDPGFQAMCEKASQFMNVCRLRQHNMGPVGESTEGKEGQAGAFDECAKLYGSVLSMCPANYRQPAPLQANAPQQPAQEPADASGGSRAPQAAPVAMSAQCQSLVRGYIGAAEASDGPASKAAYDALKQAGGCGVLAQAESQAHVPAAAPQADPRFVSRGSTPMLDQTVAQCDRQQAACAEVVRQLRAGTSPEAVAAIYANAISIGLQMGAMMGQAMLAAQPMRVPSGGSNMNSLAAPRIRNGIGQGGPTHTAPTNHSTITFGQ